MSPGHEEALSRIDAVRTLRTEVLSLSGLQLEAIPAEIGTLSSLRRLDLDDNHLTDLPDAIRQLRGLVPPTTPTTTPGT